MMSKIWQRYIFKDLVFCFSFFLLAFFLLYFLADFSTHVQDFIIHDKFSFSKLFSYYFSQLFKRMPMLLPLALLISTIKVLTSLNIHRELVALLSCGLDLKKLLTPFWTLAFFCCLLGYANEEYMIPRIGTYLDEAKQARSKSQLKKNTSKPFTVLHLSDASKLVYQSIDAESGVFFDVYWIRSYKDIWRMKYLSTDPQKPVGAFVDHIVRNPEGSLEKKESYEKCILPSLKWTSKQSHKKLASSKYKKVSTLASFLLKKEADSFHARGEAATFLCYKLVMPLMPFLMLLGVIPSCVSYSRNPPVFWIYGLSILCFVMFFTLMDSLIIIGENQTLPPYVAMWLPSIAVASALFRKYRLLFK